MRGIHRLLPVVVVDEAHLLDREHDIFYDGAVDEIHRFASGSARLINKACTHSLIYGAQNKRRIIDDHMVKHVIQGELS